MNEKSNKRISKKINSLDVAIIAVFLVFACIVAAFFVLRDTDEKTPEKTKIIYTIKVANLSNETLQGMKMSVGDDIYDIKREKVFGEIVSIQTVPTAVLEKKIEFGNSLYSSHEGKSDLVIEVEADAYVVSAGYNINGYILTVGKSFDIYNPSFVYEGGYCHSVTLITEEGEVTIE